jgi:prepilin signal peptidase PulO-like enzyme (type II secretory pathway)
MPPLLSSSLFIIGALLGAAANFLIYRQRMQPRPISPWMRPDPNAPPRRWFDRIPVFGWLSLRREAAIHGTGFWIRPLLVELLLGVGVAAIYHYEVILGGLLPAGFPRPFSPAVIEMLHYQFAAHMVLIFWMTVASLIDADETIIPDSIAITGLLIGLAFAVCCPRSLLPGDIVVIPPAPPQVEFLHIASPSDWPGGLNLLAGLGIGIGCWLFGCFALLPRTWYTRHGLLRAVRLCQARVCRERYSLLVLFAALLGAVVIAMFWHNGGPRWAALLTALIGMAFGGGIVWAVRVIGTAAIKLEAMGFGDVTLMAMIGAFLGWQASLIIFFIAPFAALVIGLLRLVLFRDHEIPYGPFLCLAALVVILCWDTMWASTQLYFAPGWLVPLLLVLCAALMPLLLYGVRSITRRF